MPTQPNAANLNIGRGKFYFNRLTSLGIYEGHRFVGDVDKGDLVTTPTMKQRYSMSKASSPLLKIATVQQQHKLTLNLMEFQPKNVSLALLGVNALNTQASASISAETLFTATAGVPGINADTILRCSKRAISSPVLTATGSGAATALVLGTDFEIEDATMGLIRILPTATTVALGTITLITAAYTAAAITFNRVTAGITTDIVGQLLFIEDNASGPNKDWEFWNVHISPTTAMALLTTDYSNISLEAEVLDDSANHPTNPLYQVNYR